MKCHDARELFSARVDDELTPDERTGLDAHLATCGECRRELARFEGTVALLHGTAPARAPAGFVDRVLAAARPVPWYTRLGRRLWTPLAWTLPVEATVVVLVAVTAVYLYQRSPELQSVTRPEPSYPTAGQAARLDAPVATPPSPATSAPAADTGAKDLAKTGSAASESPARPPASTGTEPAVRGRMSQSMPPAASKPEARAPREPEEPRKKERTVDARAAQPDVARSTEAATRDALERPAPAAGPGGAAPPAPGPPAAAVAPAPTPSVAATAPSMPPAAPGPLAARAARPAEAPASLESATRAREENAKQAQSGGPASAAGSGFAARAIAVPEVGGRLAVSDRRAAERAVTELLTRVGATQVSGRRDAEAVLVEAIVPGSAYAELTDGLARIGRWQPDHVPATTSQVRILVRITE